MEPSGPRHTSAAHMRKVTALQMGVMRRLVGDQRLAHHHAHADAAVGRPVACLVAQNKCHSLARAAR